MDSNRLSLYFHTLRKVKFIQLFYQIYYKFFGRFSKPKIGLNFGAPKCVELKETIPYSDSFSTVKTFYFLNLEKSFQKLDWNFSKFGKLWTYNLNYFDYLNQNNMSKEDGLNLILDFCESSQLIKDGYEPYPISLRGINWVKFISRHQINDPKINQQLFNDYHRLLNRLEYHILANHLIENAFSLLFGAYYFQNEVFYKKAESLLIKQLSEQILKDGAHYELSSMYHQILLHRILDCYNLVINNDWKNSELATLLKSKASLMLGWMKEMQFDNGKIAHLNDSTNGIALTPEDLIQYAEILNVIPQKITLKESGYRKLKLGSFEILFDVGQIAPSYQPGHSHADSLQIILQSNGQPIIVDTGISTYEKNARRQLERSTLSHNTITINKENSSQVWNGFRVGKRAKVTITEDTEKWVSATHDGYSSWNLICERCIKLENEKIEVKDNIIGQIKNSIVEGHLHFHPEVNVELVDNTILLDKKIKLEFSNETILKQGKYYFCQGFNVLIPASKVIYKFQKENKITISKT